MWCLDQPLIRWNLGLDLRWYRHFIINLLYWFMAHAKSSSELRQSIFARVLVASFNLSFGGKFTLALTSRWSLILQLHLLGSWWWKESEVFVDCGGWTADAGHLARDEWISCDFRCRFCWLQLIFVDAIQRVLIDLARVVICNSTIFVIDLVICFIKL